MVVDKLSQSRLRQQVYRLLELDHRSQLSRIINFSMMALIVLNVACVILESEVAIYRAYRWQFDWFERVSIVLFTLEYLLRVWVSAEVNARHPWRTRWRYIRSPMAVIDLLAVLPFYLGLIVQLDTRYLRVFRLLRIFKFTRYSRSMALLVQVLRNETPRILSAVSIMLMLILFASSAIYLVERDVQPEAFGSIPRSMWWAAVTLTTVGYGDVVPVTHLGKLIGVLITILGVGIAALPAGIIASGFSSELQHRRDEYRAELQQAFADGLLSSHDLSELHRLRSKLGLSAKEARLLFRISSQNQASNNRCPHCGKQLSGERDDYQD